ncbi:MULTISPECIES: phage integrase central domain-containing protein [unclassified Pseudoalteromonas]|uniref:phage integrase central domain-containing protein n=1 Tax=unclassified Pseudoalteromonas TaxID=194690 RepID=UPI003FA6E36A
MRSVKLKDITRREILIKVLDPITDRGSGTQANKTLSILKQMFDFAVEHDLMQGNPIIDRKALWVFYYKSICGQLLFWCLL